MDKLVSRRALDALLDAGATPDKAIAAAEEIGDIVGEIRVLKWISGATLALVLVVIGLLFQIAIRLPS